MTRWARAGVRATPAEAEQRRRHLARRRAEHRAMLDEARHGWALGRVRPWYITMALDLRGLDGPEVDEACGVQEPGVDLWEQGELYPTFEQLCALAELTDMLPKWFVMDHRPGLADGSTARFHIRNYEPPPPPVLTFSAAALRAAGIVQ